MHKGWLNSISFQSLMGQAFDSGMKRISVEDAVLSNWLFKYEPFLGLSVETVWFGVKMPQ